MKNKTKLNIILATITYICTVLAYVIEKRRTREYEEWDYKDEEQRKCRYIIFTFIYDTIYSSTYIYRRSWASMGFWASDRFEFWYIC